MTQRHKRRHRLFWAAAAAFLAASFWELLWWIFCREPAWVYINQPSCTGDWDSTFPGYAPSSYWGGGDGE